MVQVCVREREREESGGPVEGTARGDSLRSYISPGPRRMGPKEWKSLDRDAGKGII